MRKELLADSKALLTGEVTIESGRELVVARALAGRELVVPALREDASDALDPLLDLVVLGPRAPALRRSCLSVLTESELCGDASIYWLQVRTWRREMACIRRERER